MQTIDAQNQPLGLALFIKAYRAARKLAPARFLTLRAHPLTFEKLVDECAEVGEVVQVGAINGHLGKQVVKVACVPATNGLGDGVTVVTDLKADKGRLEFQIHGVAELEVVNLYVEPDHKVNTAIANQGRCIQ